MKTQQLLTKLNESAGDRRRSQLEYLCHFLDVFASGDPTHRAGAVHYGERLRDEGCDGETVIRMAATALLVAIEHEIDAGTRAVGTTPAKPGSLSARLLEHNDREEPHHDQAA